MGKKMMYVIAAALVVLVCAMAQRHMPRKKKYM